MSIPASTNEWGFQSVDRTQLSRSLQFMIAVCLAHGLNSVSSVCRVVFLIVSSLYSLPEVSVDASHSHSKRSPQLLDVIV